MKNKKDEISQAIREYLLPKKIKEIEGNFMAQYNSFFYYEIHAQKIIQIYNSKHTDTLDIYSLAYREDEPEIKKISSRVEKRITTLIKKYSKNFSYKNVYSLIKADMKIL